MCGIAGIVNFENSIRDIDLIKKKFTNNLFHRGPDANGYFKSSNDNVLLCHTRLTIIDRSSKSNQPLSTPDGRYQIIFNGEIYNYQDLKNDLKNDFEFKTNSDTEILLYLYIKYKKNCLKHISGMFSFAIWDNTNEEIFIARDPLGIKPLYFHYSGSKIIFASELRAIIKSSLVDTTLDYVAINDYLKRGHFKEPRTILKNVKVLENGNFIVFNKSKYKIENYLSSLEKFDNKHLNRNDSKKMLKESFFESVNSHLVSDFPVSIFLSGGVDSTAILSQVSKIQKPNTVSIGFEEQKWDESKESKRIAEYYGSNHHQIIIKSKDVIDNLDKYMDSIDIPSIDGLNTFIISELVKNELKYKVSLSGLGGDELFGGYASFQRMNYLKMILKMKKVPFLKHVINKVSSNGYLNNKNSRFQDLMLSNNLDDSYTALRGVFSKKESSNIMSKLFNYENNNLVSSNGVLDKNSIFSITRNLELNNFMKNQLLRDSDVFSMRWGLEIRTPFVDYNFVSKVKSLPDKYIFEKNKALLVETLNIPKHLLVKRKMGFTFPFEKWIMGKLGDELLNESKGLITREDKFYKILSLSILNRWIAKNC